MAVTKEIFGTTSDGRQIYKYYLTNSKGLKAGIINYGAILVNLFVPDKKGEVKDVVLGYDTLEPYFENDSFFGAVIGPNANTHMPLKGSIPTVSGFVISGVKTDLRIF